jgi:hypothetical protein
MIVRGYLFFMACLSATAAFANPTGCTLGVVAGGPSCGLRLGCPLLMQTSLTGTGTITGTVTYTWGTQSCSIGGANSGSSPFPCRLDIETVGPHLINASFVGDSGFANISCSSTLTVAKRRSSAIFPADQTYIIGAPFSMRVSVPFANAGHIELRHAEQLVGTGTMAANGEAVVNFTGNHTQMLTGLKILLVDDPNTALGLLGEESVRVSRIPVPTFPPWNGIIYELQHLQATLQYDPLAKTVTGIVNVVAPATQFGFFGIDLFANDVSISSISSSGSGPQRTLSASIADQWLGRPRITLLPTGEAGIAILDSPPLLVINTGGFE